MKPLIFGFIAIVTALVVFANIGNDEPKKNTVPVNNEKSKAIHISDGNFKDITAKGVVLVDFWAVWCGPCRIQGRTIDALAGDPATKASIYKMDVDKNPSTAMQYRIEVIPTIIIFKDGKVAARYTGLQSKETLSAKLTELSK